MRSYLKKEVFLASIGSGFEYYDFVIYTFLCPYLSDIFLSNVKNGNKILLSFFVFPVAYIARPLGGILFGRLGDRFGRKFSFLLSMLIMSISTFGIGVLTSASLIGVMSPILLVFFRFLQGISFGAELPGAITYVAEFSNNKNCNLSILIAGASLGSVMACWITLLVTTSLDRDALYLWGWRIPFIFGGFLAIIGYFCRRHLAESSEFLNYKSSEDYKKTPSVFLHLLKFHKKDILLATSTLLITTFLVIFVLYMPSYLKIFFEFNFKNIYTATWIGMLWCAFILPIVGELLKKFRAYKIFLFCFLLFIVFSLLVHNYLLNDNLLTLTILIGILETFYGCLIGSTLSIVSQLFPVKVRYSGIAICYNLAYLLVSLMPVTMTYLIHFLNITFLPFLILLLIALVSTLGCKISEKKLKKKF